ncbi:MAG: pitrilysin family protein [Patescibacteria group bacterium]|jgi:predicted Zn-dependent peptidase|nr:pitrilysin family protein [Patescibacteria group bacterium]
MFKKNTLTNGLTVITAPSRGTMTATILIMVGTGAKYENEKNSGLSHFLEHVFFKGTKNRPTAHSIVSELDGLGCDYNAFTGKEYTGYYIKVDATKLNKAIDILSDMFLNSKFDASEINRERGVIIEELNMYRDNPMMYIEDIFEECLYGDTPAGRDTIGTKENILNLKRSEFVNYVESQYGPENTFVVVSGNITEPKVLTEINKKFNVENFNKRGKKFVEKEVVVDEQKKKKVKIHYKKTDQVHLSLGVRSFSYDHKDSQTLKIISLILGGSMSSRLFINLRERNGLAYYVRTGAETYSDTGYITTGAGVPVDKIEKAIEIIIKEYKKITTKLVDPAELKKAKDLISGKVAIQLESSDNVANWYGRQALMINTVKRTNIKTKEKIESPEEALRKIQKVNVSDIKRVAGELFQTDQLNLAVIGPYRDVKKFEELLKI